MVALHKGVRNVRQKRSAFRLTSKSVNIPVQSSDKDYFLKQMYKLFISEEQIF